MLNFHRFLRNVLYEKYIFCKVHTCQETFENKYSHIFLCNFDFKQIVCQSTDSNTNLQALRIFLISHIELFETLEFMICVGWVH